MIFFVFKCFELFLEFFLSFFSFFIFLIYIFSVFCCHKFCLWVFSCIADEVRQHASIVAPYELQGSTVSFTTECSRNLGSGFMSRNEVQRCRSPALVEVLHRDAADHLVAHILFSECYGDSPSIHQHCCQEYAERSWKHVLPHH